ncbi:MAG TPA: polyphosphate polymerase domain-containing protein [Tenuifilaceae bacterium]|nr:polyphosphate polymerase domain-containing protein [Tenuifilaceae bacterium]
MLERSIESLLNFTNFSVMDISQTDKVRFMKRVDKKYLVPIDILIKLLPELSRNYSIVVNKEQKTPEYFSEYFDTPEFNMYFDHHNQRNRRYKVRVRYYRASGDVFLEVKLKTPKGETIKRRIPYNENFSTELSKFISEKTPYKFEELNSTLTTTFNRLTLVANTLSERVTFDFNTKIATPLNKNSYTLNNVCIVEIKRDLQGPKSILTDELKDHNIRSTNFSKYSIGCALLYHNMKSNNFKPILLKLKRLNDGTFNDNSRN